MKQINLLLVSVLFLGIAFFTSCSKDENAAGPSIDLIAGSGYITGDAEITLGDTVKVKFLVSKGDANLDVMSVYIDGNINPGFNAKDISGNDTYQGTLSWKPSAVGTYTLKFEATDKDDVIGEYSIVITVVSDYETYTSKLLYDASGTTSKTFFSSKTGLTYSVTEAIEAANKPNIDFGFLYDQEFATTKACLVSFDQYSLTNNYAAQLTGTLNATIFKTVSAAATYDNAANAAALKTAYDNASVIAAFGSYAEGKLAKVLSDGNILAFKTNGGKYGLIKIVTITRNTESANNTQTMDISVKVQK
jgi:hypothetical protein